MPKIQNDVWASEWADKFDQGWDEESLAKWVGKKVQAKSEDGRHGFVAEVIGYSIDTLVVEGRRVNRYSFLTDEGLQVTLMTKMQVEEFQE